MVEDHTAKARSPGPRPGRVLALGTGLGQHGRAEPLAGPQREFDVVAAVAQGPAEAFLRLPDPVLDSVLVQHEPFGRRLIASSGLEEDQQGLPQAGVVLVVGGQVSQGAEYPRPQQAQAVALAAGG
jgi:hypothetical protein